MWLRNIRKQKVVVLAVLFGFLATGLGLVPAPAPVQASPAGMSLQVGTDAETYNIGDTVQVTATATVDGAPVSGVQVAFEIRDQERHVKYVDQLATGASGQAVMTYRLVDTPVSKVEPGTYTIWARASWGGRTSQATATFAVQAAPPPPVVPVLATLTLGGTPPAGFKVGDTFDLSSSLTLTGQDQNGEPYDLAGKTVTWHSSNTVVATVYGSTLTAVGAGTTQVTATVEGVTSNALTFTVSAATTGGGGAGAGGGAGGAAPTAPAAPADVVVDKVEVQRQLGAGAKVVVVEVPATAAEHSVALNRDAVQALVAARVPLQVKTAGALVEIPAAALVVPDTGAELRVRAQAVASAEAQQILPAAGPLRSAGSVVDITVETAKGQTRQAVARFSQPVKVRLSYSTAGVNEARLGAYRYDEGAKAWNYIRSKVDTANKVVEFTTDHFSKYTVMEYSKTFADIASHWAKPEIELMASRWVVKGVDEERFNPEGNVTRAEFAAMLVRAMGIAAPANATAVFSDAQPGQWFFAEVMAAYNAGLVQGYGEGRFGPNDSITREQVVTMVVRAMAREGKAPKLTSQQVQATLSGFADLDELSAWAWEASAVGVETGLVKGRTSTTLNPRASSTRAEAAVLMKRLLEKLE